MPALFKICIHYRHPFRELNNCPQKGVAPICSPIQGTMTGPPTSPNPGCRHGTQSRRHIVGTTAILHRTIDRRLHILASHIVVVDSHCRRNGILVAIVPVFISEQIPNPIPSGLGISPTVSATPVPGSAMLIAPPAVAATTCCRCLCFS